MHSLSGAFLWAIIKRELGMVVLYDFQFYNTLPYSGISRYMYEILARLPQQEQVDVELFMGLHINRYPFRAIRPGFKRYFGVKLPLPTKLLMRFCRYTNKLNRITFPWWAHRSSAQIYHQHYYDEFLIPQFSGKRVLTLHDLAFLEVPHFFAVSKKFIEVIHRSILEADAIITVSAATRTTLLRLFPVDPQRVRTVYLANSITAVPASHSPVSEPYLLYVGQRFAQKNFLLLLKGYCADAELRGRYKLICFGGSGFTIEERAVLQKHNASQRVIRVSGDDALLASYYRNATALVYPSLYEGFGMPVLEAMNYGCPVIASNRTSLPEVGGDAARYFDPERVDDMVAVVKSVVFDTALMHQMHLRGQARAAEFSWERCARETAAVYQDVLSW